MTRHNQDVPKIEIWTRVVEATQELLSTSGQLLWCLSNRCHETATDMENSPDERREAQFLEAKEMLYELAHTLQFVCNTLERDEETLEECRTEGVSARLALLKAA